MLLLYRIRHDNEEEVQVLGLFRLVQLTTFAILSTDILHVVVIDCLFECFDTRFVGELNNVSVVHVYSKVAFLRKLIEAIIQIFTELNILLEAEDCPFFESNRLVNNCSKDLSIIQSSASLMMLSSLGPVMLLMMYWLKDLGSLQNFSFDCIGF